MAESKISGNSLTTHLLVQQHVHQRNLESALLLLFSDPDRSPFASASASTSTSKPEHDLTGADFSLVSLQTVSAIVNLASTMGETKLGADLIKEFERISPRRLAEEVYLNLLTACVEEDDVRLPCHVRSSVY